MRDHGLHPASSQPRADRCRLVATLIASLVATLALGGCHAHQSVRPAAIPVGAGAAMVRLHLAEPVSVTGSVTDRAHREIGARNVTVAAATGLAGRVVWAGADSIDVEVRGANDGTEWRRFDWAPTMRIARKDVTRAEQEQPSAGRTTLVVVLVVGAVLVGVLLAALDDMGDFYRGSGGR